MLISSESYVNSFGAVCPNCKSHDVITGFFDDRDNYRDVQCNDCKVSWVETFQLTGFINLVDADGDDIED